MYWNREIETLPREKLEELQFKGLVKTLRRVWGNEFYRSRLAKGGLSSPDDVQSLADLAKLPFLTKDDFRDAYPLEMSTVPRQDLRESTSRPAPPARRW